MTIRKLYILSFTLFALLIVLCWSQFNLLKSQYNSTSQHYHNIIQKSGSDFLYPCLFRSLAKLNSAVIAEMGKKEFNLSVNKTDSIYKIYLTNSGIRYLKDEAQFTNNLSEVFSYEKIKIARLDSTISKKNIETFIIHIRKVIQDCYEKEIQLYFFEIMQKAFPSSNIKYRLDITYLSFLNKGIEYLLLDSQKENSYTISESKNIEGLLFDSIKSNIQGRNFHMQQKLSFYWPNSSFFFFSSNSNVILVSIAIISLLIIVCTITIASIIRQKKLEDQKDDFINNITHEVKTPLTTIDIASNSLLKAELSQEEVAYLSKIISKQSQQLHHIFNQVLTISLNQLRYNKKATLLNIHAILLENIDIIKLNYQSQDDIITDCLLKATKTSVYAVEEDITTVFINILNNAILHNTKTKKFILVRSYDKDNSICIEIQDNGDGIPKNDMPFIFDKFYRGSSNRKTKGLGLGLYHVKKKLDNYGFSIEILSHRNTGTTVIITLKPY